MVVYEKNGIKIITKNALGKVFLSGHNKNNMATSTSILRNDAELPAKIAKMIIELEKNVWINLTERLEKLEQKHLGELVTC